MKNICILILYLIIISSHSEGQIKTFSEDESIKTAMENSRDIKIAESRIAGNKAKVDETSSLFLPQLKFCFIKTPVSYSYICSDIILFNYEIFFRGLLSKAA